ncbi:CatB-related O-acetyltransferase [Glutamicibacter arilaitensis]|uniref:CatB-related O-acetyltransferase n=1 Tax=Glutamicibacter arilaitensis TaxID=256701 RepID=UPI003FD32E85
MGDSHPSNWASTSPVFYNPKTMMNTFSADHGVQARLTKYNYDRGQINIGNDVWIGENVTLSHGISIGDGAIVASNATVTKDVPAYAVVGGLPARVLKMRFEERIIEELHKSQWWRFSPDSVSDLMLDCPATFAPAVLEREAAGLIRSYEPIPLTDSEFSALL